MCGAHTEPWTTSVTSDRAALEGVRQTPLRGYSAFGLALRAAVASSSGVQRGQTSALVGVDSPFALAQGIALRVPCCAQARGVHPCTPVRRMRHPLRAFSDATRRSQRGVVGGAGFECNWESGRRVERL
jgi:hypothetical protein